MNLLLAKVNRVKKKLLTGGMLIWNSSLELLSSHLETPANRQAVIYLDKIVRGLYFWNIYFATISDNWGILVKLVICVVPGHWKIKILNLKKRNKFFCFFMFLYPIQGGKNNGSPYLTNKSWFLANLMSRDNKIKVTLVLWHPRTLFF